MVPVVTIECIHRMRYRWASATFNSRNLVWIQ